MTSFDDSKKNSAGKKPIQLLITVIAVIIPLYGMMYSEVIPRTRFNIYPEVNGMIFLGLILPLVFLCYPLKRKENSKISWYDLLLAVIGFTGPFYVGLNFEKIYHLSGISVTSFQLILSVATVIVIIEAARRTIGLPMTIIATTFLIYPFVGKNLPGILYTTSFSAERVLGYIFLSAQGVFGIPTMIVGTIVLAFITFGSFLSVTGAGDFFMNLAISLFGHLRGGAAKVAVVSSALFGTMTGDPLGNIAITGQMTLPLMTRLGYNKNFAAGTEAVASCGGMIMPPVMGAVAFIMAEMTGLGYSSVAIAALLPALLYFLAVFMQVDFHAAKKNYKPVNKEEIPAFYTVLKEGWYYLLPLLVLVYFLFILKHNPQTSVYKSLLALLIILLIFKRKTLSFAKVFEALRMSGTSILPTAAVSAAAGIILGSVTLTGLGLNLSASLVSLAGGSLIILAILTGVVVYLMGMGVAPVATYILMAILVAPAMVQVGVPKIAAHFFILYMSISTFITPPFALASYVAASIIGADGLKSSIYAMRLGIVCYLIPFVTVFQPALLLVGTPGEIVLAVVTSIIGIIALASGLEGYMFYELCWWERLLFIAGGFSLFIPGEFTDIFGIIVVCTNLAWQLKNARAKKTITNQIELQQ